MAIVNRDKDSSEQKDAHFARIAPLPVSQTVAIFQAPHAGSVAAAQFAALTISGTPTTQLSIRRFVAGEGQTLIPSGPAQALTAEGTSGPEAYAFSATIQLEAGDHLCVVSAGANSSWAAVDCSFVFQSLQDIKSLDY